MKPSLHKSGAPAFGRTELLLLLSALLTLIILAILPAFSRARVRPHYSRCVTNLKQIGLGLRMWSGDHGEKFPMAVPMNDGGSLEFAGSRQTFRHFQIVSNEINSPRILTCATDKDRKQALTFGALTDSNLSYFVGLDASETD